VRVEIMKLPSAGVTAFGSEGVEIGPLAVVVPSGSERVSVHLARVSPGGTIGRHPATHWQVFRGAVLWSPGEVHESCSDDGMLAVIVESKIRPNQLVARSKA
jgi:hypothetical protein